MCSYQLDISVERGRSPKPLWFPNWAMMEGVESKQHGEEQFCEINSVQVIFGASDICGIAKESCLVSYWEMRSGFKRKVVKKQIWTS